MATMITLKDGTKVTYTEATAMFRTHDESLTTYQANEHLARLSQGRELSFIKANNLAETTLLAKDLAKVRKDGRRDMFAEYASKRGYGSSKVSNYTRWADFVDMLVRANPDDVEFFESIPMTAVLELRKVRKVADEAIALLDELVEADEGISKESIAVWANPDGDEDETSKDEDETSKDEDETSKDEDEGFTPAELVQHIAILIDSINLDELTDEDDRVDLADTLDEVAATAIATAEYLRS